MASVVHPKQDPGQIQRPRNPPPGRTPWAVYVYEAPVRLWHWVTVVCMLVLVVTGYLIGAPPPSIGGEASNSYLFGWIRMAHFMAGYVLAIFFVLRVYWAFVGNHHAREVFLPPVHRLSWWKGLFDQQLYYMFIKPEAKKHLGHNPLAGLAMFLMCILPLAFMILSGFALYAEGLGMQHWMYSAFGWMIPLVGGSFYLHTLHHIGMWILIVFSCIHTYLVFREDIMGRTSIVSTMISGWRFMKDDKP